MSLYGALFTGVSSLDANSRALGVTSNNIANVNTVGYKSGAAGFSTLLAGNTLVDGFASGGVQTVVEQLVSQQGLLQASTSGTHLAISGDGFFAVTPDANASPNTGELLFTRAGAFTQDSNGYLRNSAGNYLQGWSLDANGDIPANLNDLTLINVNALSGTAEPTTSIGMRANLQSSAAVTTPYTAGDIQAGTVTADFERGVNIIDSQGGSQPFRASFVKTGVNAWSFELIYDGPAANVTGNPVGTGTLTFNTDGTLASSTGTSITLPWSAASGLATGQAISLDLGTVGQADGFTQFDSDSALISTTVDGALFGDLAAIQIDEEGVVRALFENGSQQAIYKVPLVTFPNANGLAPVNGNAFLQTDNSGALAILEANTGGAGTISAAALEGSTVDLAGEFTDLITTQRAYSAATKIITTADEMLEEMIRVKR
jgi:flagellar hook protein FlgE